MLDLRGEKPHRITLCPNATRWELFRAIVTQKSVTECECTKIMCVAKFWQLTNNRSIFESPLLPILPVVRLVDEVAVFVSICLDVELVRVLLGAVAIQRSQCAAGTDLQARKGWFAAAVAEPNVDPETAPSVPSQPLTSFTSSAKTLLRHRRRYHRGKSPCPRPRSGRVRRRRWDDLYHEVFRQPPWNARGRHAFTGSCRR
ncbi:Uncharacterized protein OBRU01_19904 [Operophtera brumata]|uniref:Uncharacterized protein n=1 Tax=Operophtera brumata TaxID=104452 RepID=A0A0L7KWA2_OPEBR|nr:Uncharacterized protein OBRU01_19904 [Operophtera brumata]